MDKKEFVFASLGAIATEMAWRSYSCNPFTNELHFSTYLVYLISYIICLIMASINLKDVSFFNSQLFRDALTFLQTIDSLIIILLGFSIYFQRLDLHIIATILCVKFFLLTLIKRMVTGESSTTTFDAMIQTTKIYVHHLGSFLFLSDPMIILLTTLWRSISMSSHALIAVRHQFTTHHELYQSIQWKLAYLRKITLLMVLGFCFYSHTIRRGFGISAVGHVSYMIVRIGPVFRMGSIYIPEHDKSKWKSLTDAEKLVLLCQGKYRWLSIELLLHIFVALYFIYLRLNIVGIVSDNCTIV